MQLLRSLAVFGSVALVAAHKPAICGVSPDRLHLYEPSNDGKWHCLEDDSIILDASQINDGICDCPDGSDEPGTGACESSNRTLFYCQNSNFAPRYILNSKVGDGVCDCCDCSDELLAQNKPSYRGSDCTELRNAFDDMIKTELDIYKQGANALHDLQKKYNILQEEQGIGEDLSPSQKSETLQAEIKSMQTSLAKYQDIVKEEEAQYFVQLKEHDPIRYKFEQIDLQYMADVVDSTFSRIAQVSSAYQTLVKTLDDLTDTYTRAFNDKAVNDNIAKYANLTKTRMEKINADPEIDMELKDQLTEYLLTDLPNLFINKELDQSVKYTVGKTNFVRALITGKSSYTKTIKEIITELEEIMDDISSNYNVNLQDPAVISSIAAFENYRSKYRTALSEDIVLPDKFMTNLGVLLTLINESVPKMFPEENSLDEDAGFSWGSVIGKIGQYLPKNPLSFYDNSLSSLQNQISTHKAEIEQLTKSINEKNAQLQEFRNKLYHENDSLASNEESLFAVRQLMEQMRHDDGQSGTFCISGVIDNYSYEICLNPSLPGAIYQRENKPNGNVIKIGQLQSVSIDDEWNLSKYIEYLNIQYSETDLLKHLTNESAILGEQSYLLGNLHQLNRGLKLDYRGGEKCWNGPHRSASVLLRCGESFQLNNVQEATKCNYVFDITGPIGCNDRFRYQSPFHD